MLVVDEQLESAVLCSTVQQKRSTTKFSESCSAAQIKRTNYDVCTTAGRERVSLPRRQGDKRLTRRHDFSCVPNQCKRALSCERPHFACVIGRRCDDRRVVEGKCCSLHPIAVTDECLQTDSGCGVPHFGGPIV